MNGYNPNETMLPASGGGNIVAMSGGGGPPVSDQRSETGLPLNPLSSKDVRQQGSGAGLVFANGGGPLKQRKQRGGIDKPTIAVRGLPKSDPENIDDILQKLTENQSMKKKDTYTPQEQDTILKNLLKHVKSLQNSKSDIYTINVGLVKSTD